MASTVVETPDRITYSMEGVQDTLSKKLGTGPFNSKYKDAGTVIKKVTGSYGEDRYEYYVCLIDEDGNGFDYKQIDNLSIDDIGIETGLTSCGDLPKNQYTVSVNVIKGTVDESEKVVYEEENASFNLTPNSSDMKSSVTCDNGHIGQITNNVLTVSRVISNTKCTVNFFSVVTVLYNDGTLILNEKPEDRASNIARHGDIKKEYPGLTNDYVYDFSSPNSSIPWINEQTSIRRIEIGQKISPTNTSKWFINLKYVNYIDITNIDFSNVTDTSRMFEYTGSKIDVTSFTIKGLNNADFSNVKNASKMFYWAGSQASTCTIGDVSNWNTSNLEDASWLFASLCRGATSFDLGDLSTKTVNGEKRWDVSNVTNMERMFSQTAQDVEYAELKGLSNWDVSNVTNMDTMFSQFGMHSKTVTLPDLSNWDTGNVTNMHYMFRYTGGFSNNDDSAVWTNSIGTLKVYADDISYIFSYCSGVKATLNIYSNPSTYDFALQGSANQTGSSVTLNYSNVTTNIDNIIATKSNSYQHVTKGQLLD